MYAVNESFVFPSRRGYLNLSPFLGPFIIVTLLIQTISSRGRKSRSPEKRLIRLSQDLTFPMRERVVGYFLSLDEHWRQ